MDGKMRHFAALSGEHWSTSQTELDKVLPELPAPGEIVPFECPCCTSFQNGGLGKSAAHGIDCCSSDQFSFLRTGIGNCGE